MDRSSATFRALSLRYENAPLIMAKGSHRQMLSHVCLGNPRVPCERLSLDVHRYQKGGKSVTNVHPDSEQVYVLIEGRGEATVGGRTETVVRGDVVFIPRNTPHSIRNTGEGELKLIFVSVKL